MRDAVDRESWRRRLGRIGIRHPRLDCLPAPELRAFVREADELGFGALWFGESSTGREAFVTAGLVLASSERLVAASAIANIWARDAVAMANGQAALSEAYPGRFLLGVGVSHRELVSVRGQKFEKPLSAMSAYLDAMDETPYEGSPPRDTGRLLAALGPKMLELSGERSLGAHPYMTTVEHTSRARSLLGPDPILAVEQAVALTESPSHGRDVSRQHVERRLRLKNYRRNLRRLGWSKAELAGGGTDSLIDELVAWGAIEDIRTRVDQHMEAGADHVCVQPLVVAGLRNHVEHVRILAAALVPGSSADAKLN